MSEVAKGILHSVLRLEVSQLSKPRVSDFGTSSRLGEGIPLYYGKGEKGVFIIIPRRADLPKDYGVTVP